LGVRRVNNFTFQNEVGRGGMAQVCQELGRFDRRIAVKTASPRELHGAFFILNEAQVLSRLNHPHIIGYIGRGKTIDGPFLAIELFAGQSLADYLNKFAGLPPAPALGALKAAASALAYLHDNGLVHCDVKPGNILINGPAVKLIDFACARPEGEWLAVENGDSRYPLISGSPSYLSPDRLTSRRAPNKSDDIFALGLTFYAMLTGEKAIKLDKNLSLVDALNKALLDLHAKISETALPEPFKMLLFKMIGIGESGRFNDCHEILEYIEILRPF
jgi:serine/threonine-protein kinase